MGPEILRVDAAKDYVRAGTIPSTMLSGRRRDAACSVTSTECSWPVAVSVVYSGHAVQKPTTARVAHHGRILHAALITTASKSSKSMQAMKANGSSPHSPLQC